MQKITQTGKLIRSNWLLRLAALCLVLSFAAIIQEAVTNYNHRVAEEQSDILVRVNHQIEFSKDDWGINYQERNRHLIFILCIVGFGLALFDRRRLTLLVYLVIAALTIQWVAMMVRDISMTEIKLSRSEYLSLIAFPIDWLHFLAIVAFITANIGLLTKTTSTDPSAK
jgi:hypothetical protein